MRTNCYLIVPLQKKIQFCLIYPFYKLQSDLRIDDLSNKMSVIASLKESKDDRFTPDPRDEHMGYRTMIAKESMDKVSNDGLSWRHRAISHATYSVLFAG